MLRREKVLVIEVPGIHSELLGALNKPWDERVRGCVRQSLGEHGSLKWDGLYSYFELEVSWFAVPSKKDLDNFRLKPVLDALTREGFWSDDSIKFVRRIDQKVEFVATKEQERLAIMVYGCKP